MEPIFSDFFGSILGEVGDLSGSRKMFDDIGHPCVIACNSMLDGCGRNGEMDSDSSYFRECLKLMWSLGLLLSTRFDKNGLHEKSVMTFGEMIENERVVIRIISLVYFLCVLIWIKEVFIGNADSCYEERDHPRYWAEAEQMRKAMIQAGIQKISAYSVLS